MSRFLILILLPALAFAETKPKKKKKFNPKLDATAAADQLHPLFKLENVYPLQDVFLKVRHGLRR